MARGKAETEARNMPKEKAENARERQVRANLEGPGGRIFRRTERFGDTKDSAGRAARSDTSHQNVDGESLASVRRMPTAEKAEDNLNQKEMVESEGCGSLGMWRRSRTNRGPASITHTHREVEEGTGLLGCPSNLWASEDRRDELFATRDVVRGEFSENTCRSA